MSEVVTSKVIKDERCESIILWATASVNDWQAQVVLYHYKTDKPGVVRAEIGGKDGWNVDVEKGRITTKKWTQRCIVIPEFKAGDDGKIPPQVVLLSDQEYSEIAHWFLYFK